ncbi:phosphoglycerate dehydrogenase [bacterium]|nr:phosphoglycerate dehydrogenase [bacterium]
MKILICDSLPEHVVAAVRAMEQLEFIEKDPDHLKQQIIEQANIVIVRSATQLDAQLLKQCRQLRLIVRAGMGTDNIDIKAATQKGIAVMNTPAKNANAAAELSIALMFACARHVAQAHQKTQQGHWDRKSFMGYELMGKTLAIVGFGNVGREVAKKALAFGMNVVAYDPYISKESMDKVGVIKQSLDEALKQADVVSLHLALTEESHYLLNTEKLMMMKPHAILINAARGGLIDEKALCKVMQKGHLYAAGLDVYEQEPLPETSPLLQLSNLVVLPHLGASSYEAQDNVGLAVIEQLKVYLEKDLVVNGVNVPAILPESFLKLGKLLELTEKMASMMAQTIKEPLQSLNVAFSGSLSNEDQMALKASALVGALRPVCQDSINFVNVELEAQKRDIHSSTTVYDASIDYTHWIKIELTTAQNTYCVEGALLGQRLLKVVSWNGYALEIEPKGHMLIIENKDQPGNLAAWTTMIGQEKINIEELCLSSTKKDSDLAISIVRMNQALSKQCLSEILDLAMVHSVETVHVP